MSNLTYMPSACDEHFIDLTTEWLKKKGMPLLEPFDMIGKLTRFA